MNNKGLTLTLIVKAQSANFGESLGNIASLKKMTMFNQNYTFVSRQALRYSLVKSLEWDTTECVVDGAAQFSIESSIIESPEIDLFGYMKTKGKTNRKRAAVVRLNPAISLEEYHDELEVMNNIGLASRIGDDAKTNGQMLVNTEQHTSYYAYTLTIDLDRVGVDVVDGEIIEISQEEKAHRINTFLEGVQFLYRDIKGRRENLAPLFVIGGIYNRRNPFFMNSVYLDKKALDVEQLKDMKESIGEHTHVGVIKSAFSNGDEIVEELNAKKIHEVFMELKKEVSAYYVE